MLNFDSPLFLTFQVSLQHVCALEGKKKARVFNGGEQLLIYQPNCVALSDLSNWLNVFLYKSVHVRLLARSVNATGQLLRLCCCDVTVKKAPK